MRSEIIGGRPGKPGINRNKRWTLTSHRFVTAVAVGVLVVGLAGCGSAENNSSTSSPSSSTAATPVPTSRPPAAVSSTGSPAPAGTTGPSSAGTESEAAAYCEQQGGEVQTRLAYFGTNGDQADWLALGEGTSLCRFQADDEAKSRIYVDLQTVSSAEPTLAALAYLSKVPMPTSSGGGNPATGYCSKELDGSSTFGAVGAAGGGWVAKDDPDDVVVGLCVFPDLSFIDEWGLAYHSNGDIRGKDLTTAMKYRPGADLPPVFPVSSVAPTS
jgi:putative hemolysin